VDGITTNADTWVDIMRDELGPDVYADQFGAWRVRQDGYLSCPTMVELPEIFNTRQRLDYGMNYWGIGGGGTFTSKPAYTHLDDVVSPGGQVAFMDARNSSGTTVTGYYAAHPQNFPGALDFRHQQSINLLYADGHGDSHDNTIVSDHWATRFDQAPWGNP